MLEVVPAINCSPKDGGLVADRVQKVASLAKWVHLDVADGVFTHNVSWSDPSRWPRTKLLLEVHLMVEEPEKYIKPWLTHGAKRLIVHYESLRKGTVRDVRAVEKQVSMFKALLEPYHVTLVLAINPETPLEKIKVLSGRIADFHLLGVNPGASAQPFIENTIPRIQTLRAWYPHATITVDGGITPEIAMRVYRAGAERVVSANYLFSTGHPAEAFRELERVGGKSYLRQLKHMHEVHEKNIQFLEEMATRIRETIISTLLEAGSGHSAGPLGMADIFTALYFQVLNHDPKHPELPDRDRVVLSNGHICPVQYVTMAYAGYFPLEELKTLRKINSRLQGHPHRTSLPGLETTSGPLGSGLSQAIGFALAAQLDQKKYRVYCLASDGEHDEGNFWEAVLFAGKHKLRNLTLIVDRNNIQIDGYTEDIMPLESLRAKYESFNWHVLEINGHNFYDIISAVAEAKAIYEKPTVIIAHTIPGKGVSFMENDYTWHGKPPNKEEAAKALTELRTLEGRIQSEHE